jgi:hypothetical protein
LSQNYNLHLQLYGEGQNLIRSKPILLKLQYDVWEQIYHVRAGGQESQFTDYESFTSFVTDSMEFSVGAVQGIGAQSKLSLIITFSREELSENQHRELRSWIASEESQPALESNQSFSINISKLLSIFFSRQESPDLYIYRSAVFTLNALSQHENTAQ